jgi:hypothetical protein
LKQLHDVRLDLLFNTKKVRELRDTVSKLGVVIKKDAETMETATSPFISPRSKTLQLMRELGVDDNDDNVGSKAVAAAAAEEDGHENKGGDDSFDGSEEAAKHEYQIRELNAQLDAMRDEVAAWKVT